MRLTPLVVRSSFSFLRGVAQPKALARAAGAAGLRRLALTDRGTLRGIPAFLDACAAAGIGPISGLELVDSSGRIVLIARSKEGFSALCRCLSEGAEKELAAAPSAGLAVLERREGFGAADLFCLSDSPSFLSGAPREGGVFSLLTPCNRRAWTELLSWGGACVASPELSFLEPGQRDVQRLLLAIGRTATYNEVEEAELDPPEARWSDSVLDSAAWSIPSALAQGMAEAFEANAHIASEALVEPFSGFVFPGYEGDIVSGGPGLAQPLGQARPPAASILASLVREGALLRYGAWSAAVAARAEYELRLIEEKGFCDYFLVVRDIVRRASRVCGRGSAAASLVAYCLGITEVDPLRHDLYFDRFLNPGRTDPPDIDVDFAWDERDEVMEAVAQAYGRERTARVANHVCFRPLSALRETARAFGMPEGEIAGFERALRVDKEGTLASADREWRRIASLAESIVGLPRHLGAHSGGLILVPDRLADHAPIEATGSGIRVVSWDKDGAERAGLVKIDLLGNRSLAVVRDAARNLVDNGLSFPPPGWDPLGDEATIEILARGDTMGVFYVESPAMRILQAKAGKGDFEHLVIHSSMIRPAANRYIDEYVDRLKGKPWKPFHPLLADLFAESFGILCYQEDVSKAAMALAGFSSVEADGLRKILSRRDAAARLAERWPAFRAGAAARGVGEDTIREVWDMMCSFSGYSFVKAHSASYAMLSFQSAYLRAHHPAEFMAAVLSNHGGFYSPLAYASEARRMGLELLSPDVGESEYLCRGRDASIRFGLCMIPSLSRELAEDIVAERRRGGPYASVEDFGSRVEPTREGAEALVGSGALDSLCGGRRAAALMILFSQRAAEEAGAISVRSPGLFDEDWSGKAFPGGPEGPSLSFDPWRSAPVSLRRKREAEMKYLGTSLSCHPLELWPKVFSLPRTRAASLPGLVGRRVDILGWPITAKPVLTAQEEAMEFVSFEDETAIFEAVLFPEAFRRYRHLLFESQPLWVAGRVEEDRGAVTLSIHELRRAG